MARAAILKGMIDGYAKLNELLAEVGEERMTIPGVAGDWSIKDIIAHISVYEWWTGNSFEREPGQFCPIISTSSRPIGATPPSTKRTKTSHLTRF